MTSEIVLQGLVCYGHTKVAWLPNLTRYPNATVSDFEADGAMNASFHMWGHDFSLVFEDGRWAVKGCMYVTDPQRPNDGLAGLLKPGEAGFWTFRYGPSAETDWQVGQVVNLVPCTLGQRFVTPSEPDEYGKFVFSQQVFVSGKPLLGTEIQTVKSHARSVAA